MNNFRGFSDSIVRLRQVNFLVGENSTGKTSFLSLLSALSHMAFWILEPNLTDFAGKQQAFLDLVSAADKSKRQFSIGALEFNENNLPEGMLVTYVNGKGKAIPQRVTLVNENVARTICGVFDQYDSESKEIRVREAPLRTSEESDDAARLREIIDIHQAASGFKKRKGSDSTAPLVVRLGTLFETAVNPRDLINIPSIFKAPYFDIAPIRSAPRRTYDEPQTPFASTGEHVPYIIRRQLGNRSKSEAFEKFLKLAGQNSGLFSNLTLKQYGKGDQTPFEIQILLEKTQLGISNVGYGVSQSLPIIVDLFVRPQGSSYLIQQPEVHLHPRAQAMFGDVIASLARDEKKAFIVETHSDFLIDRFRRNVREDGEIDSQIIFFERANSVNQPWEIVIQSDGGLPDDQPQTYREFFLNESISMIS